MGKEGEVQQLLLNKQRLKELHSLWTPDPHQIALIKAIFQDGYKRVFIRGGRKSGKTESFLYVSSRLAATIPKAVCSIIGPSFKQQKKILWHNRRLQDFIPREWAGDEKKADAMIYLPWHSFIELDGSENAESHRGEEQDLLVLDELKDHEFDSYNAMYPNLAARDGILIVVGSPPRDKQNMYYELEQEARRNPKWKFFHWRCWDNPHISRAWFEEEKEAYYARGDGYLWEQEYEANYVFGGKDAVFSVFDREKHILPHDVLMATIEKDKNKLDYLLISDPGNRVCHANLFIAYDPSNGFVWVLDEIYETELSETPTGKIYPRLEEKWKELFPPGEFFWNYDEAALWFANEVGAQFPDSPPMTPTAKGTKNKEVSMGIIKACMASGKYYQSDRCEHLAEELVSYYLDKKGRYIKERDHAIDCLRYFFDFVGYSYELTPAADLVIAKKRELDRDLNISTSLSAMESDLDMEDLTIWH